MYVLDCSVPVITTLLILLHTYFILTYFFFYIHSYTVDIKEVPFVVPRNYTTNFDSKGEREKKLHQYKIYVLGHSSTRGVHKVVFLFFLRINWTRSGFCGWAGMKPPWLNRQRKYQKQQSILITTKSMVRFSYWSAGLSQLNEIFRDQVRLKLVLHCRITMEAVADFTLERKKEKLLCQLHIYSYVFLQLHIIHNMYWYKCQKQPSCLHLWKSHVLWHKGQEFSLNISPFLNVWTTKDLNQWAPLHLNIDFWSLPEDKFNCSLWKV